MPGFIVKRPSWMLRPLAILFLTVGVQPAWAAGPPAPSPFSNPLTVSLIVLMLLLLIIIGILANILVGSAEIKMKRNKKASSATIVSMVVFFLLCGTSLFAQGNPATPAPTTGAANTIGGMSATTFYIMAAVIFLELGVIIVLLLNIKTLLKAEKMKEAEVIPIVAVQEKKTRLTWWDRFNKLRPVAQEADLDLGHDYDGIRELNNRLPPWWLYGFYASIIFAAIYLWRYHVSHSAPLSQQEYEIAVAKGEREVQEYLKMKGENVDENTVTLLKEKSDLEAGKAIFTQDGLCGTCHGKDGSGMVSGTPGVGPNLTDDYWIHGGDLKSIFTTIKYGINGKGMPEWGSRFSPKEIAQIASYVKTLRGTNPAVHKNPDGQLYKEEAVEPAKPTGDSLRSKDNRVVTR